MKVIFTNRVLARIENLPAQAMQALDLKHVFHTSHALIAITIPLKKGIRGVKIGQNQHYQGQFKAFPYNYPPIRVILRLF